MNDVHKALFWMKPQGLDAKFPAGRMGVEEAERMDGCIHWDIGSAEQKVLAVQSCMTLCDPRTATPQAPLSMEFSKARILEWVAIPFSRAPS